jgi:hypothetical protein
MKHTKDTVIEIREVDGALKLFVHTDLTLWIKGKSLSELQGIPVLNPLDGFKLFDKTNQSWQYIDRNDVEIMWCNAKGETSKSFNDVVLQNDEEYYAWYDAWFVAKVVTNKMSEFTNSRIGSTHWLRTIISEHSRIGEFLNNNIMDRPATDANLLMYKVWGERLYKTSKELIEWSNSGSKLTLDNE